MKIGFDNGKYLEEQSKYILERVNCYDKLYLEFGGKLLQDLHAKRVLPGFDENVKIKLLHKLKDKVEVIICVYAGDIERNKIRGDFGITYDKCYENISLQEALEIVKNPSDEIIKLAKFNIALYLVFAQRVNNLEDAWKRLN